MAEQKEIIKHLKLKFGEDIREIVPFPKPFFKDPNQVKAIYLGCDPSTTRKHEFKYAFAIGHENRHFKGFVTQHANNLDKVGLKLDQVYVQNLCQNYFKKETSKNLKVWKAAANEFWIEYLRKELDELFDPDIPVLLTSQYLLEVLGDGKWKKVQAPDFYQCKIDIPIPANENKLGRPLIPMYRGKSRSFKVSYHLKNEDWKEYRLRIKSYLESISAKTK